METFLSDHFLSLGQSHDRHLDEEDRNYAISKSKNSSASGSILDWDYFVKIGNGEGFRGISTVNSITFNE